MRLKKVSFKLKQLSQDHRSFLLYFPHQGSTSNSGATTQVSPLLSLTAVWLKAYGQSCLPQFKSRERTSPRALNLLLLQFFLLKAEHCWMTLSTNTSKLPIYRSTQPASMILSKMLSFANARELIHLGNFISLLTMRLKYNSHQLNTCGILIVKESVVLPFKALECLITFQGCISFPEYIRCLMLKLRRQGFTQLQAIHSLNKKKVGEEVTRQMSLRELLIQLLLFQNHPAIAQTQPISILLLSFQLLLV